jgi:hypothetical protein
MDRTEDQVDSAGKHAGLYTYGRQPKFDPTVIRAINEQRAAIESG